jgi:hypothetical protein
MPLTPVQIKTSVMLIAGTLEQAAQEMSDDEYEFNGNQLSKVINGHSASRIIRIRLAKFLGKSIEELFDVQAKAA